MEASEPKTVSEVIVKEKITEQTPEKEVIQEVSKKQITKKVYKKKVHKKKVYKKKKAEDEIDVSQLQDVQTLGVVNRSEPFELNH
jgi:hypothetical protein